MPFKAKAYINAHTSNDIRFDVIPYTLNSFILYNNRTFFSKSNLSPKQTFL